MIISGGMNIYPAEIEAALDASPDIYEVAVFGIPNEEWGESVHAVVVPARAGRDRGGRSTAFAREHLAGYKVPRSVSFVRRAAEDRVREGAQARSCGQPFWPAPCVERWPRAGGWPRRRRWRTAARPGSSHRCRSHRPPRWSYLY